jgi:RHH-type transcriptional regulator, rel operon repressor / antitoxin RelB
MLSLRIPDFLETELMDICKEEKKTKTTVIKESLLLYIESRKQKTSAYELGKKYFGKYETTPSDKSVNHKELIRKKIRQKHNA